jgi:hypothetical protein
VPDLILMARDGDDLPATPPPAFAHAQRVLTDLLDGVETPNAFVPPAPHVGFCRICGEVRPLSYEHIPPRTGGNATTARGVDMWTVATSPDPLQFPTRGWFPAQRGIGGYVLCEPCNNNVGGRYATAYGWFAKTLLDRLAEHHAKVGHLPGTIDLSLLDWPVGDIARAGLIALMDLGIHDRLLRRYPGLTDLVVGGAGKIPTGLQLGLTLALGRRGRLTAPICTCDEHGCSVFAEVALAPFAWTLSITENGLTPLSRTADVSDWLSYPPGECPGNMTVPVPLGFLESPIPGDFRPPDQVLP